MKTEYKLQLDSKTNYPGKYIKCSIMDNNGNIVDDSLNFWEIASVAGLNNFNIWLNFSIEKEYYLNLSHFYKTGKLEIYSRYSTADLGISLTFEDSLGYVFFDVMFLFSNYLVGTFKYSR